MRIAIIFISDKWDASYSLSSVVTSQINSFVNYNCELRVITKKECPNWKFSDKIDYRPCLSSFEFNPRKKPEKNFNKKVKILEEELFENLKDIDIVIEHDGIFLDQFMHYNLAIRNLVKRLKNIKWLHWMHSGPNIPKKKQKFPFNIYYTGMDNSYFVSVTKNHVKNFSKMYNIPISKVKFIHNSRVSRDFLKFDEISWKIIEKYNLFEADIISIFPTSISRTGKQLEIILFIMASLKEKGKKIRIIFPNSFAIHKNTEENVHILLTKWLADKLGLSEDEVIFTSDIDKELRNGCSPKIINDLFTISNLFIHPSVAETCSLTLLEAAITKNLCVLNKNTPSFSEIAGNNALYYNFPSLREKIAKKYKKLPLKKFYTKFLDYYKKNKVFYRKIAKDIINNLEKNKALSLFSRVKKNFNEKHTFETQLKPLLEEISYPYYKSYSNNLIKINIYADDKKFIEEINKYLRLETQKEKISQVLEFTFYFSTKTMPQNKEKMFLFENSLIDFEKNKVYGYCPNLLKEELPDIGKILQMPLGFLLQHKGYYSLHGSLIHKDSFAVIFTGEGGCGKSTFSSAMAMNKYNLSCDDLIFIKLDEKIENSKLIPFMKKIKLEKCKEKQWINLNKIKLSSPKKKIKKITLIFPKYSLSKKAKLNKITRKDCTTRLISDNFALNLGQSDNKKGREDYLNFLSEISKIKSFELEYNDKNLIEAVSLVKKTIKPVA
jgi:hypothetical protein